MSRRPSKAGAWGWVMPLLPAACGFFVAACGRAPVGAFEASPGFSIQAEGDSGQTISGKVTGPYVKVTGLKVAVLNAARTLVEGDVSGGSFSLALPNLVPAIPADLISKYDEYKAKLKESKSMNPIYTAESSGWPYFMYDGFWLTLYQDTDQDGKYTHNVDRVLLPAVVYRLVFQNHEDPRVSKFKKGWHVRFQTLQGGAGASENLTDLEVPTCKGRDCSTPS